MLRATCADTLRAVDCSQTQATVGDMKLLHIQTVWPLPANNAVNFESFIVAPSAQLRFRQSKQKITTRRSVLPHQWLNLDYFS